MLTLDAATMLTDSCLHFAAGADAGCTPALSKLSKLAAPPTRTLTACAGDLTLIGWEATATWSTGNWSCAGVPLGQGGEQTVVSVTGRLT
jgi:hypothetical protein